MPRGKLVGNLRARSLRELDPAKSVLSDRPARAAVADDQAELIRFAVKLFEPLDQKVRLIDNIIKLEIAQDRDVSPGRHDARRILARVKRKTEQSRRPASIDRIFQERPTGAVLQLSELRLHVAVDDPSRISPELIFQRADRRDQIIVFDLRRTGGRDVPRRRDPTV